MHAVVPRTVSCHWRPPSQGSSMTPPIHLRSVKHCSSTRRREITNDLGFSMCCCTCVNFFQRRRHWPVMLVRAPGRGLRRAPLFSAPVSLGTRHSADAVRTWTRRMDAFTRSMCQHRASSFRRLRFCSSKQGVQLYRTPSGVLMPPKHCAPPTSEPRAAQAAIR